MNYFLIFLTIVLSVISQLLLKKGISGSFLTNSFESILSTLLTPYVFLGFITYGVSAIVWLFVLQKLPLSLAYPSLSISYLMVVILSYIMLDEPINTQKIIGSVIIIVGVFILFK